MNLPGREEGEDVVLALLGQPGFLANIEVHLLEVDGQYLRSKYGDKMLGEGAVLLLHR